MEIICKKVSKIYKIKDGVFKRNTVNVLNSVDLEIKQGEIIALVGESGQGKSTLVNLLSGRDIVSDGEILVDSINNYKVLKKNSEVVKDLFSKKLLNNETVYNNLVYFGKKLKLSELDIEKKIVNLKNVFEFDKFINRKVSELDKVNFAKVNLAIYMMNNPLLLVIDGCFGECDILDKNIILKDLKRLNKEFKTTIIVVSSDLMDVAKICKRIIMVRDGAIVIDGNYDEVKEKYFKNKVISIIFKIIYKLL